MKRITNIWNKANTIEKIIVVALVIAPIPGAIGGYILIKGILKAKKKMQTA